MVAIGQSAAETDWWPHLNREDMLQMGDATAIGVGQAGPAPIAAIETLGSIPGDLQRLLRGHSVASLRRPASDGGWGIVEHLCHLRDWNAVFGERVAAMATLETPVLETYDDELWVIEHHYRDQDPLKVLSAYEQERRDLIAQLWALPPDAWMRSARLGQLEMTIARQVEMMRDHDLKHYGLIAEALA